MKVRISVPGSFHAMHLANQLQNRGAFEHLYTTHPSFMSPTPALADSDVTRIRYPEGIMQLGNKIPALGDRFPTTFWKNVLFDRAVARRLPSVDEGIFVGFAGCSLQSIRKANERGWTTVIENSSAHMETQRSILKNEYERLGLEDYPSREKMLRKVKAEYEHADYIMTPSSFAYDSFVERGFDPKTVLKIPLGVDPEAFPSKDSYDENFTCIFAGYVGVRKGVIYLLEAWEKADVPDGKLVLTSGIDSKVTDLITPYYNSGDVEFVGYVDDLAAEFRDSSMFVFPSLEDGFGRVVVEAMSSGLPVVVSQNTGAKDCVREGTDGFVTPIRDVNAIAERIERLYRNPTQRQSMGMNAREHVVDNYTWDDYGELIYETYERILH